MNKDTQRLDQVNTSEVKYLPEKQFNFDKLRKISFILISAIAVAIGCWLYVASWSSVEGRITGTDWLGIRKTHPGGFEISYTYKVNGIQYGHQTFQYVWEQKTLDELISYYKKGDPITVHYNPDNPQESYVVKPESDMMY